MRCAAKLALVTVSSVLLPLPGRGQSMQMPTAADGYTITKTPEVDQPAPPGYEGRTHSGGQTAIGNTDATRGKKYLVHFTFANEIKICPKADGTAEGDGELSGVYDFTDSASGAATHLDMHAIAKYKGKVGDDALLVGPVTADVDYSYKKSERNGAHSTVAAPPDVNVTQHVTAQFVVFKGEPVPKFDAFSGGDAGLGHLSEAYGTALALGFWAGVYYSVAETEWTQDGFCVHVVFGPPSNSVQPVLGGETKVIAEIKTKGGEGVRGIFPIVKPLDGGGSISITSSATDPGSPAIFYYTAPNTKVAKAGFAVAATSRGGAASGRWETGLGTGWSGEISVSRVTEGDEGNSDLQTWSNFEAIGVTIDVKDGVGTAVGHGEARHIAINRHNVARGGVVTQEPDNDQSITSSADGAGPAKVSVELDQANGTYSVVPEYGPFAPGKTHYSSCDRDGCSSRDTPYG
ncbi:MAG TPA: hypothetical protein VII30_04100, partial [Gemmatimonadaceae bacterium]